jgi:hypothetical protein
MQEAVATINDIRRESEMTNRALELSRLTIAGLDEGFEFFGKQRRLLREEKGVEVSTSEEDQVTTCSSTTCWMFTDCLLFCSGKKQKKLKLIGFVQFGSSMHVKELQMNTAKGIGRFLEFSDTPQKSFIMQFPNEQVFLWWRVLVE